MYQQLKSEIKDIIEIVNQCPDPLKEKCFEVLLENYLLSVNASTKRNQTAATETKEKQNDSPVELGSEETCAGVVDDDICEKDFHVKTLKFLRDNNISMQVLNHLYYKENGELKPFYETLKSTSMQECQMRLAVLTAFENSFAKSSSEMTFDCEAIRSRCQTMKCYNATNFAGYFKTNRTLWEEWPEKFDKSFIVTLSAEGKKKLAEVLLDLVEDA